MWEVAILFGRYTDPRFVYGVIPYTQNIEIYKRDTYEEALNLANKVLEYKNDFLLYIREV